MSIISQKSASVVSGIRWSALGEYSTQGALFLVYVVLARLLEPGDFGLLALAMVFIGITDILARMGINTIVIQQKNLSQELLSSLFFLNLAVSFAIGILLVALGPLLGALVKQPQVTPMLQVLSITFIVSSAGAVHDGLLRRKLLFNRIAIIEFSVAILKGTIAISLALAGWQVWALVAGVVVETTARTLLLFFASGWRPRLCFKWREINSVKSFILHLTGFGLFNSFAGKASNFIIGRFLGAASLGYYSVAFRLYTMPNQFISHVVGRVLLSSLAEVQDNKLLLKQRYLRACAGVALLTFPLSIGLAIVAKPFVLTLYGAKWQAAIPVIVILSLVSSLNSIAVLSGNIFIALRRTGLWFGWGVFSGTVATASLLVGLPWGLIGVCAAFAISTIILVFISFIISFRLIDLRISELFGVLRPFIFATALMGSITFSLSAVLEYFEIAPAVILGCCIAAGFLTYSLLMLFIRPAAFLDFLRMAPVARLGFWRLHRSAAGPANISK